MAIASDRIPRAAPRSVERSQRRRQARDRRTVAGGGSRLALARPARAGARAASATAAARRRRPARSQSRQPAAPRAGSPFRRALPDEIRGVHVTMALAVAAREARGSTSRCAAGLNTIELDVKDENGQIGFVDARRAIAAQRSAPRAPYYDPRAVARRRTRPAIYLIGRVVTFEDPIARRRSDPALAVHRATARSGTRTAGLGWLNPYDRARLALRRRRRRRGGEGRLRRDPVRLRPLPERRRRLDHPLPRRARRSRWAGRSPRSCAVRRARGCTRSACASRPTSSASRRRATSASASTRGGSRRSSTRSTRWSTRRTTARASTTSPTRTPSRGDGLATRCATSARSSPGARRCSSRGCRTSRSAARTRPPTSPPRSPRPAATTRAASCSGTRRGLHDPARSEPARRRRCR